MLNSYSAQSELRKLKWIPCNCSYVLHGSKIHLIFRVQLSEISVKQWHNKEHRPPGPTESSPSISASATSICQVYEFLPKREKHSDWMTFRVRVVSIFLGSFSSLVKILVRPMRHVMYGIWNPTRWKGGALGTAFGEGARPWRIDTAPGTQHRARESTISSNGWARDYSSHYLRADERKIWHSV